MRYWLMRAAVHITDIHPHLAGRPWQYERIFPDTRLKAGDIAYLAGAYNDLYSWGYVSKIERSNDISLSKEMLRITVIRPVLREELVSAKQIQQVAEIASLFSYDDTNLIKLTSNQALAFNQLIRSKTRETPPDPDESDDSSLPSGTAKPRKNIQFVLNQKIMLEEVRFVEFKEIKGNNPTGSIKNTADEYAVAFHNSEGGRIYWGIRDDAVVVGIKLDSSQRNEIRHEVSNKLGQIQPPFPLTDYRLEFRDIINAHGESVEETFVVELEIPRGDSINLYATGGGDIFLKTVGGKRKLNHQEAMAEILRRNK